MEKFIIFYATITDEDEGAFVDYPFFGGVAYDKYEAEILARDISNDKNIPGAIITKIYNLEKSYDETHDRACRHFNQLARDMYDVEDRKSRR